MDVPCKKMKSKHHTAADPVSETEWCPPPPPVPGTAATQLDTQIRSLAQLIGSTADVQGRKAALVRITRLVRKTLSGGKVRLIGSAALGLALPTSDVDLTVLGRSEAGRRADLDALQAAVQSSGLGHRCLIIHAKKVSILKFVEARSGLSTDLSVAVPGGLTTLAWMRGQLAERPSLHPLLLVLKLCVAAFRGQSPSPSPPPNPGHNPDQVPEAERLGRPRFRRAGLLPALRHRARGGLPQQLARPGRAAARGAAPLATRGRREQEPHAPRGRPVRRGQQPRLGLGLGLGVDEYILRWLQKNMY